MINLYLMYHLPFWWHKSRHYVKRFPMAKKKIQVIDKTIRDKTIAISYKITNILHGSLLHTKRISISFCEEFKVVQKVPTARGITAAKVS